MSALISTQELITLTNFDLSGNYTDTYLSSKIDIISDHVESYCLGTLFSPTEISDEQSLSYVRGRTKNLEIRLKYAPLISVGELSYKIGSDTTSMASLLDNANLDLVHSRIYLGWYGPLWRIHEDWWVLVSYMAGHTSVPDLVKMAAALLVREAIDIDDRAAAGSTGALAEFQIGNYRERYYSLDQAKLGNLGAGTQRSRLAAQYLKKYRRVGVK